MIKFDTNYLPPKSETTRSRISIRGNLVCNDLQNDLELADPGSVLRVIRGPLTGCRAILVEIRLNDMCLVEPIDGPQGLYLSLPTDILSVEVD